MLGGRAARPAAAAAAPAVSPKPPTHRVPGASLAAAAEVARGAPRPAAAVATAGLRPRGGTAWGPGGAASANTATAADTDEDGFRMVLGRRRRTSDAARRDLRDGGGTGASGANGAEEEMPGRQGKPGRVEPMAMGKEEDADEADDDGQEEAEQAPGPAELRRRWLAEVGIAKHLARQGLGSEHPAMAAAVAARDAAEKKWRDAKEPAPIAKRLGWAHQKLDRAVEIQAETRAAIAKLEEDFNAKRAELQARLDEDSERVRKRRSQLAEVQGEAGAGSPLASAARGPGGGEAVRRACGAIRNKVAPALSALAEQLGTDTQAWATVNGLLSSLAEDQRVLDEAAEAGEVGAEAYDIAGDDLSEWSEGFDDEPHGDGVRRGSGGGDGQGMGSCVHEADTWAQRQLAEQYEQRQTQEQRQQRHCRQELLDPAEDDAMGDDGRQWQPWDDDRWREPKWSEHGHGRWARASWADSWEQEQAGARADADAEGGEPHNKHRRVQEPAAAPQPVEAITSGGATAATQQTAEQAEAQRAADAARQHAEMLAAVTRGAIAAGVQPITETGSELHLLDIHQLAAWAAEHLPTN